MLSYVIISSGSDMNNIKQDKQCTYNVTLRRVRATIVAVEKAKSTTYSECVPISLGIQHAVHTRRIVCGLPALH